MKGLGYITLSEAEQLSGIKADTLKKRCQEGNISGAIKQGKTWFIPESQIVHRSHSSIDDRLLAVIASFAEGEVGTGITLFVNGSIFTGNLISTKAYLSKLIEKLKNSPQKSSLANKAIDGFTSTLTQMYDNIPIKPEDILDRPINAIHLECITYKVGTSWDDRPNEVMRIKLNAIDGFIWGRSDN